MSVLNGDIATAPVTINTIGNASSRRVDFCINKKSAYQRDQYRSQPYLDFPILLKAFGGLKYH